MKVLFVFSGNSPYFPISPFTKAQGEALTEKGVEIDYFPLIGKGFLNYFRNIFTLRKYSRKRRFDLLHAHYSLSGWVAVLAFTGIPVVVSLMGDDAQGTFVSNKKIQLKSRFIILLTKMIQPFVKGIISKSADLEKVVYRKKISYIIPNGIQLNKFIADTRGFRAELGLEEYKRYILFLGSPTDKNKNFKLAKEAVKLLTVKDVELINVFKESTETVARYLNSADVFVLCSFAEGSANVIKEAMACNCPMVVTDAGDAAWVIGDTEGCYLSGYDAKSFSDKLTDALEYAAKFKRTKGRDRIISLGLDAESTAEKIVRVYKTVLAR